MLSKIINENTAFCRTAKRKDGTPTMYGIKKEEIQKYIESENIYFLSGGILSEKKEIWMRFKDHEIHTKNYFAIDIDLRNQFDGEISNIEIVQAGLEFVKYMDHELFKQWSYIVFSGNGLHIYYVGKEDKFRHRQFKLGVKYIFKMWDEFIGDKALYSDHACCNLARILRLPESINQKNGAKVKILAEQDADSDLFNNIKIYALISGFDEIIKTLAAERELKKKKYDEDGDDLYDEINQIPSYEIAMLLIPNFPFSKNGKNFDNKKGGFTGYFYNKDNNSIVNGGSRYFLFDGDSNSNWNNFSLVKHFYTYTNNEVFDFFKKKLNK